MLGNNFWKLIGLNKKNETKEDVSAKKQGEVNNNTQTINSSKPQIADVLIQNVNEKVMVWRYPSLSLLSDYVGLPANRGDVKRNADTIEKTLDSFGIQAKVAEVNGGPTYTQYVLRYAIGTRLEDIFNLREIIAANLTTSEENIRIYQIEQTSTIAIDIKNITSEPINFKYLLASEEMRKHRSKLAVVLGQDNLSRPLIADLDKLQNILICGYNNLELETLINSFLLSLLFRNSPDELKLILIDPKRVELTEYNDIPHLLTPVVTEPEKILSALKWSLAEIHRRYKLFQSVGVKNIQSYNEMSSYQALPYVVIIINDLTDLMTFAPVEIEEAILGLTKDAHTVGVYLIIAAELPANLKSVRGLRHSFKSKILFKTQNSGVSDSLLGQPGAEKLTGNNDMLLVSFESHKTDTIYGVQIQNLEVENLINYLKNSGIAPTYATETKMPVGKLDDLFEEAVRTVSQYDRASISLLQRMLRIGYARASWIIDELEEAGVVGTGEGSKPRDVLVRNADEFFSNVDLDKLNKVKQENQKSTEHILADVLVQNKETPQQSNNTQEEQSTDNNALQEDIKIKEKNIAENETELVKKENKIYQDILKEYKHYIEKFCEIAEREVSNVDEWGDENLRVFPKLMKECLSRIARGLYKEAYLKSKVATDRYIDDWFEIDLTGENIQVKNKAPLWARNLFTNDLPETFSDYHKERQKKILSIKVNVNNMTGVEFESYIATILKDSGFNVSGTPTTGDQGADLIATKDNKIFVIQAKRYSGTVGNKAIQEVVGALSYYEGDVAVVVTNSKFTLSAKKLARKCNAILVEKSELNNIASKLKNK